MDYQFINTDYIMSVTGGDPSIVEEIVDLFKEQVEESTQQMNDLFARGDYFNLGLLAHKVKSSAAILGMDEMTKMLKTFELEAKGSVNTGNYRGYIDKYVDDSAGAIKELAGFIESLS